MENSAKKFLFDLLKTDSPSGDECRAQRVWLDYVKKFATVKTDIVGNAIGAINENAEFKIMLAGHCDEIAMIVNNIDENGFIHFEKAGWVNPWLIPGLRVTVKGYKGKDIPGIIGFNLDKKEEARVPDCSDYFIDCGIDKADEVKKLVRVGDYIVYKSEPEIIGDNKIICKALDNKTGAFIVAEVLRKLSDKKIKVGVYAVSTTGEETNQRGAHTAAASINPNLGIACDVTFNTDMPNESSKGAKICFRKGPALSVGSPINKKANELLEAAAKRLKMPVQFELTPDRTHTDADRIMYANAGIPVALVSLPIRYMHSPIEEADLRDIDDIVNLLVEMISKLKGNEELRPIIP